MSVIFAPKALIGNELQLERDLYIEINTEGYIQQISSKSSTEPDFSLPFQSVLIPGFINAHTHIGDSFLKDQGYGLSLQEVVGKNGLKHSKLEEIASHILVDGMKYSLQTLIENGFTSFIDYRESGLPGVIMLKNALDSFLSSIRGIVLGRPTNDFNVTNILEHATCEGIGFSTIFTLHDKHEEHIKQIDFLKPKYPNIIVSLHVSETEDIVSRSLDAFGKTDVQHALDLYDIDFVVHANYADIENDLQLLKVQDVGVVCCPLTTMYFGLKFPPIKEILDKGVLLGLGTDNILMSNPDPFHLMKNTLLGCLSLGNVIEPIEILKALTVNAGIIAKRKIGRLETGYSADFVAINLESVRTKYSKDVYTAITLRATPNDIIFQMFNGKKIK